MKRDWRLYILILLPVTYIIIFNYLPMYGVQIAFKDFSFKKGIMGSPWVGFKYFITFFHSPMFGRVIKNSLTISLYSLLAEFPMPIILALALNEIRNGFFKRTVQLVTYAPHFISTVVMVSMVMTLLSPRIGIVNIILQSLGGKSIDFMADPNLFSTIYVWSGVWQNIGWDSIIYLAALSSIDSQLYDAVYIDGASRFQKIWHVDIPGILPTIIILLILSSAGIMSVGFEKIFLMQNNLNLRSSEVIDTYVYKVGLVNTDYSFSTAIGLFNSIISFTLLTIVNYISRKVGETSLW